MNLKLLVERKQSPELERNKIPSQSGDFLDPAELFFFFFFNICRTMNSVFSFIHSERGFGTTTQSVLRNMIATRHCKDGSLAY